MLLNRYTFLPFVVNIKRVLKSVAEYYLKTLMRTREIVFNNKCSVVYFPYFDSQESLNDHYHRAVWYLPFKKKACEKVCFFCRQSVDISARPDHMCTDFNENIDHIKVLSSRLLFFYFILSSRVLLCWNNYNPITALFLKYLGYNIVNVATNDFSAKEYGAYCGILWDALVPIKEKRKFRKRQYVSFHSVCESIKLSNFESACVFGTGPSLEGAYNFDFSKMLSIVCNSIVQNGALLKHINPCFVTAGDVISHFGVSRYAMQFRIDLKKALDRSNMLFVTTAKFGYLFIQHYPELEINSILIEQFVKEPVLNLTKMFYLPFLDSTLNIHMLPLANTFCEKIFFLGVDGKSDTRDNEDHWAHAKGAQYHELVNTGHLCHPTFSKNREAGSYEKFNRSVKLTIEIGERYYDKKYLALNSSKIDILYSRYVNC